MNHKPMSETQAEIRTAASALAAAKDEERAAYSAWRSAKRASAIAEGALAEVLQRHGYHDAIRVDWRTVGLILRSSER